MDFELVWWIGLLLTAPSVLMSAGLLVACFWMWLSVFKSRRERLLLFTALCVATLEFLGLLIMIMADRFASP